MSASLIALLTVVEGLVGEFTSPSAGLVQQIISALIGVIPTLTAEIPAAVQSIQNTIAVLRGSGNITADQITQLQQISDQIDAQLAAAAQADGLTPPAAPGT
jgi:hypothetical protein